MKCLWRSVSNKEGRSPPPGKPGERVSYESVLAIQSKALPGVKFVINRISFGRRMELSRRVREITQKAEFLEAGSELAEKIEAGILSQEVDAMYLRWAFVGVDGLEIDGQPATADQMLERGPERLAQEIVAAIKNECGLSEAERKN